MKAQHGAVRRNRAHSGFALVTGSMLLTAFAAQAQQPPLPPAATPGGAQPREQQRLEAAEPAGELFTIPRVIDRPLGLEEGPRLKVSAFKLAGADNRPEAGIRVADVQALLDQALQTQPEGGYTVNQLQEVAAKVTDYYRRAGLVLAYAFVPAQTVTDGQVVVQVLEGRLGAIRVEGNNRYSANRITRPFADLLGGPVEKNRVETSLLRLSDYPGLAAFGVFNAGQEVGTTDLLIRVQKEERARFDASLDNHGSQFTGEYRGQLGFTWNNVTGNADRAHIYVLSAFDPGDSSSNGLYGGVDYEIPFFSPANSLLLSYAKNTFEVGQEFRDLGAKGDTDIASLTLRRSFSRSRLGTSSLGLGFSRKQANFDSSGVTVAEDVLAVVQADLSVNYIDTHYHGVNQFDVAVLQGLKDVLGSLDTFGQQDSPGTSRSGASGDFTKVAMNLQRLQRVTQNSQLLMRVSGQYSDDLLVSLEQFSLGGPDTVRAYPAAEVLADKGALASLELIFNAPGFAKRPAFGDHTWGQVLQLSLFVDYANGQLNSAPLASEDDNVDLAGWGAGLQFSLPGRFFARLDVATPITDREASNGRDPQYYLRFACSF